jgi:hypothetical protein
VGELPGPLRYVERNRTDPMIIALKGPAQCGKSTLASWIEADLQRRGINTKRTAFSDFVREELSAWMNKLRKGIFDNSGALGDLDESTERKLLKQSHAFLGELNFDQCVVGQGESFINKALSKRPASNASRWLQQWWGQDFRRAQDPLYWIKKSFAANADFILQDNAILIEESCRQENEGRYVHALGGIVLDLKPLPSPTHSEAAAMSHSIEQAALQWEGEIPVDMGWVFSQSATNQQAWVQDLVGRCIDWIKANGGTITGHH